jgi:hypothetical protein
MDQEKDNFLWLILTNSKSLKLDRYHFLVPFIKVFKFHT